MYELKHKPEYVVDAEGQRVQVALDHQDWEVLCERFEELEDTIAYLDAKLEAVTSGADPVPLEEVLARATAEAGSA